MFLKVESLGIEHGSEVSKLGKFRKEVHSTPSQWSWSLCTSRRAGSLWHGVAAKGGLRTPRWPGHPRLLKKKVFSAAAAAGMQGAVRRARPAQARLAGGLTEHTEPC
jgi:hypothetical protein